jgi:phosphoribosylglycinamide formyltransferase-1
VSVTHSRARLAVLASGGGSNLQAIHDFLATHDAAGRVELALVVSDRRAAGALERARGWNVPAVHLPAAQSDMLDATLREHGITHIALAGYLRLIPQNVVERFQGKLVNVHPALLPAFGGAGMFGAHVHAAVLRAGERVSGPTVHFVSAHYDEGAIIAQSQVPVLETDTVESLAARVLTAEHVLYPPCVYGVATGAITLGGDGRVHGAPSHSLQQFEDPTLEMR